MYKLNRRIVIEKYSGKSKDENGNLIENYSVYYICWARFKSMSGKKFAQQQATHYKRLDSFVIRFCIRTKALLLDDLELYRVIYQGKKYKIKYPYNIEDKNNYIDLECEIIG